MSSTPFVVTPVGVAAYLPGRPHAAITVVNNGPAIVYLGEDDVPNPPTNGHPLRVNSTIVWDRDRALYLACPTNSSVVLTENSGQVFDAASIAGQILDQGLAEQIAQQINVLGVPQVDAAVQIVHVTFQSPGGSAGSGSGGGGGGTGGTGGTGGATPDAFAFGASGHGVSSGAFNTWLTSHDLTVAGTFNDQDVDNQTALYDIQPGGDYASWPGILNLAVGGIYPSAGDTWAAAAAGSYDARWTACLQAAKAGWGSRSPGRLHLRFAHEMNGSFNPWHVGDGDAANFRTAFGRFYSLKQAIFPGCQVVWCVNDGTSSLTHVSDLWPGTAYVDIVGVDHYNAYPHVTDLSTWTSKINTVDGDGNPVGIEKWRQQAATWGKPLAICECGNPAVDVGSGSGGGDDPYWATALLAWGRANGGAGNGQVLYAIYFNYGTGDGYAPDYLIFSGSGGGSVAQPNAAAAIRATA